MTWLVTTGLTNAVLAALLAVLAWAVGRWARRPALTHVLWVLALVKLLTPPVFEVPIGWRIDPAAFGEAPALVQATATSETPSIIAGPVAAVPDAPAAVTSPASVSPAAVSRSGQLPTPAQTTSAGWRMARFVPSPATCLEMAVLVWAMGSLAMAGLYVFRMRRFGRYLRLAARSDGELSERLAELAAKARLPGCPRVVTVESTISPMLFGLGRGVVLIFPAELNRLLKPAARDTLLLHELAHYARGDHWVRLVELLAQVVFWWHPVVWWARRELEAAEEECCDAWVVERQAGVPRLYAEALLATIDFLCGEPLPLPPAACGLGDVPFLRARLTQIIRGRLAAQLSPAAKSAVFLAAVFVLPLGPALFGASVSPAAPPEIVFADKAPAVETVEREAAPVQPQIPVALPAPMISESPTVQAVAALLARPQRSAELWAMAVSPGRQYRLEVRTGYQVMLVRPDSSTLSFISDPLVKCASFGPKGEKFATGHDNGEVKIYDCLTGARDRTLKGAPAAVCSVAYSPDGSHVAAGTADGSVIVWDAATTEASTLVDARSLPVSCLRWSPAGDRLAVALGDFQEEQNATLLICDANNGQVREQYALAKPAGALEWREGGQALLIADWSGNAAVWRVSDGFILDQFSLRDRNSLWGANWSPNCPLD